MRTFHDPAVKAAALADYAAGMSSASAGIKWGISSSAILRYARAAGVNRGHTQARIANRKRREAEIGLTGGRWVPNSRGIQVWVEAA